MFPGCYQTDEEKRLNDPADGEWLESVGADFHRALNQYALGNGMIRVLYWPCETVEWFIEVRGEIAELPHVKTQRDVRKVCEALGIALTR